MAEARRRDNWRCLGELKAMVARCISGNEYSVDDFDPYSGSDDLVIDAPVTVLRDMFCGGKP